MNDSDDESSPDAGRTNEIEYTGNDSRSSASLSSSARSVEARAGPFDSPGSPNFFAANSPASSSCTSFSRPIPTPSPNLNTNGSDTDEAHVCKSMDSTRQFAVSKAVSLGELKRTARKLGLVVTMGSRAKGGLSRIGFGLKSSARRQLPVNAARQYPKSFFKFSSRKDGYLHPGKKT